ncbi:DUF309 domain-containing protein [Bacillus sp. UMB0899]|uniref:DUF309 domain-containing protein n=1 Tax=Metabacillus schmidteae TaxID=2730405 RepID=UPI000C80A83E|nr:DUF309 domain-containing protein [Metabacillus schmidteae]PMC39473.1 DUF309 domain-containing protein [Bacillus sp. UMB0899]
MFDRAYIDYLLHFHCDRDYFECHEVLEEHWKKDVLKDRKKYWVGLIQIAVALYHHRRGNFSGALKMISNAIGIIESERDHIEKLGLHSDLLMKLLVKRKNEIQHQRPYTSIDLPIKNKELMKECLSICKNEGIEWGAESNLTDKELIHRHKRRDRTDVIEERLFQLEKRKVERSHKNNMES